VAEALAATGKTKAIRIDGFVKRPSSRRAL